MPLSVGDRVSNADGTREGRLIAIEDGVGVVLQSNGVEIEFPLGRLRPFEPPPPAQARTLSGPLRDTRLTPLQRRVLDSVPPEIAAAVARSYDNADAGTQSRPSFASLPDSKRLDVIRIYLPSLPQALIARHTRLVIAMRDLPRPGR